MAMYSRFSKYLLAHGNPKKLQKLLRNSYLSTISQMENQKQSIYLFFMYVMCKKKWNNIPLKCIVTFLCILTTFQKIGN